MSKDDVPSDAVILAALLELIDDNSSTKFGSPVSHIQVELLALIDDCVRRSLYID